MSADGCPLDPGVWRRDPAVATGRALRVILAIALDRETAAACLGHDRDAAVALWPSSLYALLAAAALASPTVRRRCFQLVDARLGEMTKPFEALPPATLARHFVEGRAVLSTRELAALLWLLLRRDQSELALVIARLGAELEVAATRNGAADTAAVRPTRSAARAPTVRREAASDYEVR